MTGHPLLKWIILAMPMGMNAMAGGRPDAPTLPTYKRECASCHVPYPPGLLPAQSWQRIMSNLSRHFGTNASTDAAQVEEISAWLAGEAGTPRQGPPPQDRITRSEWFVHEHGELPATLWKRGSVRSASNCAACHTRANEGDFRERYIRISR